MSIRSAGLAFRTVVTTIINAENDITSPRQAVHISDIALGCAIDLRWNVAMIEDNRWPAAFRHDAVGNSQQGIDFEPFRKIVRIIATIIGATF